ncbi:MAG TPA: hypothetical protein VM848_09360 [Acidimicrobiia bacterium]|nr:hypothetical protein [Acidimicrobiia bacterium]
MTKRLLIVLVFLLAACGGANAATTTTADEGGATTTTVATSTTEDESTNETVDLSDMPQECIDAFVHFLQAIEPVVEDFDFETATMDDITAMSTELEPLIEGPTAEMDGLNCPDVDATDEEAFAAMIDIAEREAPGTVAYFQWIETFASSEGGEVASSGDCETDIEAMEALIADKETMGSLTFPELTGFGELMTAITTECSADRVEEFFDQPEVEAFMNSGG